MADRKTERRSLSVTRLISPSVLNRAIDRPALLYAEYAQSMRDLRKLAGDEWMQHARVRLIIETEAEVPVDEESSGSAAPTAS